MMRNASFPYIAKRTVAKRTVTMGKGCDQLIDYSPLWETMRYKGVTQYRLLQNGIDNRTLNSLKKNNNITILTLEKICRIINCTPKDVVRFIDD